MKTRLALSVRQPLAWLIVNGLKDVVNRSWPTQYRGPLLIHAGPAEPPEPYLQYFDAHYRVRIPRDGLKLGGIVGAVELVDCVTCHPSKWFRGPFGLVLAKARVLPFKRMAGKLKFFGVEV